MRCALLALLLAGCTAGDQSILRVPDSPAYLAPQIPFPPKYALKIENQSKIAITVSAIPFPSCGNKEPVAPSYLSLQPMQSGTMVGTPPCGIRLQAGIQLRDSELCIANIVGRAMTLIYQGYAVLCTVTDTTNPEIFTYRLVQ